MNLISFSFYSSTQRLEENDVKLFWFFLSATRGEFAKGKAFFYYHFILKGTQNME